MKTFFRIEITNPLFWRVLTGLFVFSYSALLIVFLEAGHFLTQAEVNWLKMRHGSITVTGDPQNFPLLFLNDKTTPEGLTVDFLAALGKQLDCRFVFKPSPNAAAALAAVRAGEVDVLSGVTAETLPRDALLLSSPYAELYTVRVSRQDAPSPLPEPAGPPAALLGGHAGAHFFKAPRDDLPDRGQWRSLPETLRSIADGTTESVTAFTVAARYYAASLKLDGLRFAGDGRPASPVRFAVSRSNPFLASIIDKGIGLVSPDAGKAIFRNWLGVSERLLYFQSRLSTQLLLLFGGSLLALVLLFVWNYLLKRDVIRKTRQLRQELDERKKIELRLLRSKEHLHSIFYATQNLYYIFDASGACLQTITSREDLLLHAHDRQPTGRHIAELFAPPLAGEILDRMHEALARGESSPLVYEIVRPGKTVWFEGQAVPLSGGEKGNGRQVTWIARDITSQHRHKEDVRVLSNQLALTEERQRRAIAVELHDSLGQILATMKLKLGLLRKRLANGESGLFDAIAGQLDASIELTRTLVWELSPPTLYTLGLVPAAEWLGEKLTESHDVDFHIINEMTVSIWDHDLTILLFRIIRELMTNVIKHSQADVAQIKFSNDTHDILVSVIDNGPMHSGQTTMKSDFKRGFGLLTIQESIRYMGGDIAITVIAGETTIVRFRIPFAGQRSLQGRHFQEDVCVFELS